MMDAIKLNKKIIAIPREEKYNELVGDQKELVKYLESKKYVVGCYNINKLEDLVEKCLNNEFELNKYIPETDIKIKKLILEYINNV